MWASQLGRTKSSLEALIRDSTDYLLTVDYKASLQNELSTGAFIERVVLFLDSVWMETLYVKESRAAKRRGRRWCNVSEMKKSRKNDE